MCELQVESLAQAMYAALEWSGCAGSEWDVVPQHVRVRWADDAARVLSALRNHA